MKAVPHFFRLATALSFAAAAATAAFVPARAESTAARQAPPPPAVRPLILSASSIRSSAWRSGSPAVNR